MVLASLPQDHPGREDLERIINQIDRVSNIVRSLLDAVWVGKGNSARATPARSISRGRLPSAVQCAAGIETGRPCGRRRRSRKGSTMTTTASTEALIANLDKVANEVLEYLAGPGRVSGARVDRWQARDILMHFIYFHDATAWGIQSAALGGPPWPVPADSDTVNEACRRLHEHESFDELLTQLRQAHARLLGAARRAPDLDKPCLRRSTGEVLTGRQRLELLARHWAEHVSELQAAAGAR
jgi:hypothetical protein